MKPSARFATLCLAAAILCITASVANAASSKANSPKAVIPSTRVTPLPAIEKPAEVKSAFPELPPSRPCTSDDMRGLFHLISVYEDPQGVETSSFRASPNQYIQFRASSVYARINMEQEGVSPRDIAKQMRDHAAGLLQYVIQDNGFIYFYQNSVAIDVQACFVVATGKGPFKAGQFLFMPPKGQIQGHLVKVYEYIGPKKAGAKSGKGKRNNNPSQ